MNVAKTENSDKELKKQRDWFGYVLTGLVGILVTVVATWYQLYATEKQATAAEIERARAVRQSVIAIVEEQALNGIKLEAERITRLLDQRRRDNYVSFPISTGDVVEQAEFNIASSTHLGIVRKEQIKPVFDVFYADMASRSFQAFPPGTTNASLLNELAKQIQDGKTAPALANLRRLQELNFETVSQLTKKAKPTVIEAFEAIITQPHNLILLAFMYLLLVWSFVTFRRRRRVSLRSVERQVF